MLLFKWGYPKIDGLKGKILLKRMIWGYPHLMEAPNEVWLANFQVTEERPQSVL